jgi:hypothetical protein
MRFNSDDVGFNPLTNNLTDEEWDDVPELVDFLQAAYAYLSTSKPACSAWLSLASLITSTELSWQGALASQAELGMEACLVSLLGLVGWGVYKVGAGVLVERAILRGFLVVRASIQTLAEETIFLLISSETSHLIFHPPPS